MNLGFVLFDYFPFGGLQRDCLRIASLCAKRGHEVTVIARTWQGEPPESLRVQLFGQRGWSNISRNRHFFAALKRVAAELKLDGRVGFNRAPGLDVYYAADPCYVSRIRRRHGHWYRWLPRYRHYAGLERELFGKGRGTSILLLTPRDIPAFQSLYGTESERLHLLPPGIARQSYGADARAAIYARKRSELGIQPGEKAVLFVGSGFRTKGLDRALEALAAARNQGISARLIVIGQDAATRYQWLARRLGVEAGVAFLGGRKDVPECMVASDALIHPAYSENTGTVLLEAVALGLPVLCTDVCGYAFHIEKSGGGIVLPSPFSQDACNRALIEILTSEKIPAWRANGLAYAAREDLYSCHEKAAEIIEEAIRQKQALLGANRT